MGTAQSAVVQVGAAGGGPLGVTAAPFIRRAAGPLRPVLLRRRRRLRPQFRLAGFGDAVQAIRAAHRAGDRASALAAVPDEMVDAINVVGDQALVADTIAAYRQAGVDVPVIFPLTRGAANKDALEPTLRTAIAPASPAASRGE